MKKKKENEVSSIRVYNWEEEYEIPKDAKYMKIKVDYSSCIYECDTPEYIITFLRGKNETGKI